jgi:C4-dicarboxylate-binding protein DctP
MISAQRSTFARYHRAAIWMGVMILLLVACGTEADPTTDDVDDTDAVAEGTDDEPDDEQTDEVYEFRIATAEGIGTSMEAIFDEFVDQVADCSGDRLVGSHFPGGQLGDYNELIDGNRIGTYEITSGGFDTEGERAPDLAGLSLGYLLQDDAHVDRVIDELLEDIAQRMDEATGVSVVAIGTEGTRHLVSTEPVLSLADLQGLKMRATPFEIPIGLWTALGAQPTPVPFSDTYSALETGVVDAAEGAIPTIQAMAFHEPAPNITLTHHWINLKAIRVNTAWLESLPAELQECVWQEAADVAERQRERRAADETEEVIAELEAQGVEFHELDDLDEWRAAAQPYTEEYLDKYPEARDFIERVQSLAP